MTTTIPFGAEPHPSRGLSQLAAGAILTRARRLFSSRFALGDVHGNAVAAIPTSSPEWPRQHLLCSFERRSTHNHRGYSSERNEVGVQFGADVVVAPGSSLVGHLFRRPSLLSPSVVSVGVSQPHSGTDGDRSDGELVRNHESFDRKCGE